MNKHRSHSECGRTPRAELPLRRLRSERYKDIDAVMAAQTDLVEVLGQLDPKLVKMCPAGDRAEEGNFTRG